MNIERSPRNEPQYWSRPNDVKNSTQSSAVQSETSPRGVRGPSLGGPNLVGVFSDDGISESVGEASESVGRCGDVMTLRSYSSSASESAS